MESESQDHLNAILKEESVSDLILDAGYQNLSLKFCNIKSVVDNVVKYLEDAGDFEHDW